MGGKQSKLKIDIHKIPTHIQSLLWFDKIVDVVVISLDVACYTNIFVNFIMFDKDDVDKPSGSFVDVSITVVWTILVVASIKTEILSITNSL